MHSVYRRRIRRSVSLLLMVIMSMGLVGQMAFGTSAYQLPQGVDPALQAEVQAKIDAGTAKILERIKNDMTSAVAPLIPQMATMASGKTQAIGPQIEGLSQTTILPSLKIHVEEQARIVAQEVLQIVGASTGSAGPQTDPTSAIRSALLAAIPRLQSEAIARANSEQEKDMASIRPQVEAMVQASMKDVLTQSQALVAVKLKEAIPATKKAVDEEITAMINAAAADLPEDQKNLIAQMRPQFEAELRPVIYESLFDAVSDEIDQQVIGAVKGQITESIKGIVATMNQYSTNFAVTYGKSLLPPQVDQIGIRAEIEKMIDDAANTQISVFEARIMAVNEEIWKTQSSLINGGMHTFVKEQAMAILNGTAAPAAPPAKEELSQPAATANSAAVRVNNQNLDFDVPPVVQGGRVLVPLRAIFEALGAEVSWNAETQTISATKKGISISLQPGNSKAVRNGQVVNLDAPPQIVDGRTMVPVRFVSEALGAEVNWNGDSRTVIINEKP